MSVQETIKRWTSQPWAARLRQPKAQLYLGLFGIASIGMAIVLLVILPQREQVEQLRESHRLEGLRVRAVEEFILAHPRGEKYVVELAAQQQKVQQKLPDDLAMGQFLQELEQAAVQAAVQLRQIKPGATISKGGYRETPLEVQVRGNFFQLLTLVQKIEEMQRFSSITAMNIGVQNGLLDAKLTVAVYSFGAGPQNTVSNPPPNKGN